MSGELVFVTGANGFIGSHLVRHLAGLGFRVRGLVRKGSSTALLRGAPVQIVTGDLFDRDALESGIKGCSTVYHAAGLVESDDVRDFVRVNAEGTLKVIRAAEAAAPGLRRFLYVSSISVMGPSPHGAVLDERSPLNPVSVYGKTKLRGEELVKLSSLPWTIVRPTNTLGPGQKDLFAILQALRRGFKPLIGTAEKQTTICFVWDLVRGMVEVAESERALGRTYIISTPEAYSFRTLMDTALAELGRKRSVPVPFPLLLAAARLMETSAFMRGVRSPVDPAKLVQTRKQVWFHDPGAIERDLGFRTSISPEEGIGRTIEHYRANGWRLYD